MQSDTHIAPVSKKMIWAGRVVSALPVLFLLMDGVMKLVKPAVVVEPTVRLGYLESVILPLGLVLLACTVLYVIPRTSVLGAILLTGYLEEPSRRTCALAKVCFNLLPDHPRRADLGRALVARYQTAGAHSSAKGKRNMKKLMRKALQQETWTSILRVCRKKRAPRSRNCARRSKPLRPRLRK